MDSDRSTQLEELRREEIDSEMQWRRDKCRRICEN